MSKKCIIIIANDPDESQDLAALEPVFGKQKSFYLGRAMFFDTLTLCLSIPRTDTIVCYHPDNSKGLYEQMINLYSHEEFDKKILKKAEALQLIPQDGDRMMSRIADTFAKAFDLGYQQVAMVGAYCLALDHHLLNAAYLLLNDNDVIIGPSFNGRYYLFGMSRPLIKVFDEVKWESNDFYIRLNENIRQAGAKSQELELSYEVYSPEELNQLILDIERWRSLGDERTAYHTERCLRAIQD
jgi:glycosyltransferase A (GT-A) superfamily protein (DUF2064 family)